MIHLFPGMIRLVGRSDDGWTLPTLHPAQPELMIP